MRDILGFTKEGTKLYIKPNIPKKWKKYKVTYKYIDTLYIIDIFISKESKITIDNEEIKENYIKLVNDKKDHHVKVTINDKED
jgi:cellobiose phosphorylase